MQVASVITIVTLSNVPEQLAPELDENGLQLRNVFPQENTKSAELT